MIINHIYAYKVVNQSENALQIIGNLTTRSINFSCSYFKSDQLRAIKDGYFFKAWD